LAGDSATEARVPHLVLVGLPGAGKTTVGRAVAQRLGRRFLDFDEEIVRREARSIEQIFRASGERHFRALEQALTRELANEDGMVLAPGGGWAANEGNVALLAPRSRIIYLRVTPESAALRLGETARLRPLLGGSATSALRELLASRRRSYESADAVVDTEDIDLQQVIDLVAHLAAT
jgi:shikimate kinase